MTLKFTNNQYDRLS